MEQSNPTMEQSNPAEERLGRFNLTDAATEAPVEVTLSPGAVARQLRQQRIRKWKRFDPRPQLSVVLVNEDFLAERGKLLTDGDREHDTTAGKDDQKQADKDAHV